MIPELVKKQIRNGENKEIEFVRDTNQTEIIAKTVCAFLNTNGGVVFCGINESGKIIGIDNSSKESEKIQKYLHDNISPKVVFSVTIDEEDGKQLVTIEVPFGKDRPYVFKGAVYFRKGTRSVTADSASLKKIIQTVSTEAERWERRQSLGLEKQDLVNEEIKSTVNEGILSHRFEFKNSNNIVSILEDLALCRSGIFTNAADVLFAKNPALRQPQTRVRATRYAKDKGSDEYIDDKVFQGPLVQVLNELINFINRNTSQSTTFEKSNLQHDIKSEYPEFAIREGLVNAFAHRDYSNFSGGISVNLYPTRLEIWNSGQLAPGLKPNDLKKNHPSLPTNPDITHVLYIRRLMNRIGRGTQKIIEECRINGMPTPTWKVNSTGVKLTLFTQKSEEGSFNERQISLLEDLKVNDAIKPSDYHEKYAKNVSERQARRDLTELVDMGFLERIGKGAASKFMRTNRTLNMPNRT